MNRLKRYGFIGYLRLLCDLMLTKLLYPRARIIRHPFYLRGASRVRFGRRLTTGVGVRIETVGEEDAPVCLTIGDDVEINDYVHIGAFQSVDIGNSVLIASRVFIADHNHGRYDTHDPSCSPRVAPGKRPISGKPVRICDRVWIGEQVCILPGVTIGEGAIIGAGAVVTKNVPPNSVAIGNPARVIRQYNETSCTWDRV